MGNVHRSARRVTSDAVARHAGGGLHQRGTGKWLSAIDAVAGVALADHLRGRENFFLEATGQSRALANGETVAVRSSGGKCLTRSAVGSLRADSVTAVTFTLDILAGAPIAPIEEQRITGFVSDMKTHADYAKRTSIA
ncbi:MAG: hypothetical protein ABI411_16285 [Tahibacter sp.]